MSTRNGYIQAVAVLTRDGGSILVEVLLGLVLLAVLIGPLAAGVHSGIERATRVRTRASAMSLATGSFAADGAWGWGLQIVSTEWRSGPALHIQAGGETGLGRTVGVWLDGWFLGEQDPDDDGRVVVKASTFSGAAGLEVTVRLRAADSPWGPAWRSIVPDLGGKPLLPAPLREGVLPRDTVAGEEDTVAHSPSLANPFLAVSGTDGPVEVDSLGTPYVVPVAQAGGCYLTLGEETQSWWMEAGRALDLYF